MLMIVREGNDGRGKVFAPCGFCAMSKRDKGRRLARHASAAVFRTQQLDTIVMVEDLAGGALVQSPAYIQGCTGQSVV